MYVRTGQMVVFDAARDLTQPVPPYERLLTGPPYGKHLPSQELMGHIVR